MAAFVTAIVANVTLIFSLGLFLIADPTWQIQALPQPVGTLIVVPLVLVSLPSRRAWTRHLPWMAGVVYVAWLLSFCWSMSYPVTGGLILEGAIAWAFCAILGLMAVAMRSRRWGSALFAAAAAAIVSAISPAFIHPNPVLFWSMILIAIIAGAVAVAVLSRARRDTARPR